MKTEHQEQVQLVRWFRASHPSVLIFAIPNGGYRSRVTASRLKAEGLVRGIPDLYVPAWSLWIEMKRSQGGSLSPDQKAMIEYLKSYCKHTVMVAKGANDAIDQIEYFVQRLEKW